MENRKPPELVIVKEKLYNISSQNHYIQNVIINHFEKKVVILMKVEKYNTGFVEMKIDERGDLFILPAFTDSHIHMRALISSQYMVKVHDDSLLDDLQSSKREIIIGRGWKKDFSPEILNELDRPCLAVRVCGHIAYCNEKFKREFNLKSIAIKENELVELFARLDEIVLTEESLKIAEEKLMKKGIYRVIDMGSTTRLAQILERGRLQYYLFFDLVQKDFLFDNKMKFGERMSENVRVLGIKIYLDGSMGAGTAALFSNKAKLNYTDDELKVLLNEIDKRGLAVAAHAIGDRAVNQFVRMTKNMKNDFHKLEHCQFVKAEDIKNIPYHPGIQPYFYFSDRLWANTAKTSSVFYPLKSIMERKPLGGSDHPVEDFDPFKSIKLSTQRIDGEGISMREAIEMYTKNPDEYLGEELNKQILVENFYSDSPRVIGEVKI